LPLCKGAWPETADSKVLNIGRCGGGCELQPAKMTVAPPPTVVKHSVLAVASFFREGPASGTQTSPKGLDLQWVPAGSREELHRI
jgi:hypothetical protein